MTTLADMILQVARELPSGMRYGTSTATGNTTYLVDTVTTESDDFWNGGTLFVISGTTGATDNGKTRVVTDYANSTGYITFTPALSGATIASISYAICKDTFPKAKIINAINQAINGMPLFYAENTATTTTANTYEYALPAGVSQVQTVAYGYTSLTPRTYTESKHWEEVWVSGTGYIRFDPGYEPGVGYTLRLRYVAALATLALDADVVDARIPLERLKRSAVVNCLRGKYGESGKDLPYIMELLNEAKTLEQRAISMYPMQPPPKTRLFNFAETLDIDDNWPAP